MEPLTLRIRKASQRLPDEYVLDPEYSIDEVQDEINQAIDQSEPVRLVLEKGDIMEFDPREYQVISVAYPTDLTDRR